MSLLGGIGLFAAIANYRKAKKEYKEAIANAIKTEFQESVILASIETYEENKYKELDVYDKDQYNPNLPYDGIIPTPILNIYMLTGRYCKICQQVSLINVSQTETVEIEGIAADWFLYKEQFTTPLPQAQKCHIVLKPRQQALVTFKLSYTKDELGLLAKITNNIIKRMYPVTDLIKRIRESFLKHFHAVTIVEVKRGCGLGLIVSANIAINYCTSSNKDIRRAYYEGVNGTVVYQGDDKTKYDPDDVFNVIVK